MNNSRGVTLGILLIAYKDGPEEQQPIRWVRLDDFTNLRTALVARRREDSLLAAIRAEVARLRAKGIKPEQMNRAGINLEQLKMFSDKPLWPIKSYNIETTAGIRHPRLRRTHKLQLCDIAEVALIRRQVVHE